MTTGEKIKVARKKANMTQAQLAEKLGIPYQSIGQWERDIRKPKKDTLESIAKALNIDPLELSDSLFDEAFLSSLQKAFGFDEDFRSSFLAGNVSLAVLRSENDVRLMEFYDMLNELGQEQAVDFVFELSEKAEYLKDIYTKTPEELKKLQENNKPLPYPSKPQTKDE